MSVIPALVALAIGRRARDRDTERLDRERRRGAAERQQDSNIEEEETS